MCMWVWVVCVCTVKCESRTMDEKCTCVWLLTCLRTSSFFQLILWRIAFSCRSDCSTNAAMESKVSMCTIFNLTSSTGASAIYFTTSHNVSTRAFVCVVRSSCNFVCACLNFPPKRSEEQRPQARIAELLWLQASKGNSTFVVRRACSGNEQPFKSN